MEFFDTTQDLVHTGMRSPWGSVQYAEMLTPFLGSVSTAGHGGLKVSPEYNKKIPPIFRKQGGWYEEDCAWAIPMFFLMEDIREQALPKRIDYLAKTEREGIALKTLKTWYWKEYEAHFDIILDVSESNLKADYIWVSQNATKWQVICANCLENDDIQLILTIGGRRSTYEKTVEEKTIIMDKDVYKKFKDQSGYSSRIALDSMELIIWDKQNDPLLK